METASRFLPAVSRVGAREKSVRRESGLILAFPRLLLLSLVIVLLTLSLFGDTLPADISIFTTSIACIIGILVLHFTAIRGVLGDSALAVLLTAFVVRTLAGVIHHTTVLDPAYFDHPSEFRYFWDYQIMHEKMIEVRGYWLHDGFLSSLPQDYYDSCKDSYFHVYNALLYYFAGVKTIHITAWNSLHHVYTAAAIGMLAIHNGATKQQALLATIITAFNPFGIFSNEMWRDSVGQTFLVFCAYLLVVYQNRGVTYMLLFPACCYIAWVFRRPYPALFCLAAGVQQYLGRGNRQYRTAMSVAVAAIGLYLLSRSGVGEKVSTGLSLGLFLRIPLKTIRILVGPFPWWQVFYGVSGWEFMPADFLEQPLLITIFLLAWPHLKRQWLAERRIDPAALYALMVFISATLAPDAHTSYGVVGIVLLLPICRSSIREWFHTYTVVFSIFILANILYWFSGLYGSNFFSNLM